MVRSLICLFNLISIFGQFQNFKSTNSVCTIFILEFEILIAGFHFIRIKIKKKKQFNLIISTKYNK